MISQCHAGDAVKNVLGSVIALSAIPEADQAEEAQRERAEGGPHATGDEISGRQLGIRRQAVDLGAVDEQEEGIETAQHLLVGTVEIRARLAALVERAHTLGGQHLEIGDRSKVDRVGRARLRARGLEPVLQPVVAERALLRGARRWIGPDDPERAGPDAVAAAVAGVGLDHHRVELRPDDGAGRAHLETARPHAVLAHIAHQEPAAVGAIGRELLDEPHVAPVRAVEAPRVVVAVARERVDAAVGGGELVPLLAGDLAGLAADADRGVGEETHRLRHQAFSTLHTKALPSWIDTLGSPTSEESSLTTSPVEMPSYPQCHGIPTWWIVLPSIRKGRSRRVTRALARIVARGLVIFTQSRLAMSLSRASSGLSSMNSSGCSSVSHGFQRLIAPAR